MKDKYLSVLFTIFTLSCLNAQIGEIDTIFGNSGIVVNTDITNIDYCLIRTDGKIIAIGYKHTHNPSSSYKMVIAQYNADGTLDTDFGESGLITPSEYDQQLISKAYLQDDGKLLVVTNTNHIIRYNTDGIPDINFGNGGIVAFEAGTIPGTMTLQCLGQQNGKILVEGTLSPSTTTSPNVLIRLNSDGTFDNTFGNEGMQQPYVQSGLFFSMAVLPNGDILTGGKHQGKLAVRKFHADGSVFSGFGDNGLVKFDFFTQMPTSVDPYGIYKIVPLDNEKVMLHYVGGGTGILRIDENGAMDNSFSEDGKLPAAEYYEIYDFFTRPDGSNIITGIHFSDAIEVENTLYVGKVSESGIMDSEFGTDGYTDFNPAVGYDYAMAVSMQPDGKIIMAGSLDGGESSYGMLMRFTDEAILNTNGHFKNTIKLSPNPFTENITILDETTTDKIFRLYETNGKCVTEKLLKADENTISPNISSGLYLYEIEKSNGQKITGKIVKK